MNSKREEQLNLPNIPQPIKQISKNAESQMKQRCFNPHQMI